MGHLAAVCYSKSSCQKGWTGKSHPVNSLDPGEESGAYGEYQLNNLPLPTSTLKPLTVAVNVHGVPLEMEVETGLPESVSRQTYELHANVGPELRPTGIKLKGLKGFIPVLGEAYVVVTLGKLKGPTDIVCCGLLGS